ncbi:MAG: FMN-binding protein [Spirochaetaceae bacterium]|jgi:major membrane immunogen (membrane-anchored lipoprotein)|nr:FMN-binding protein [Spirochaetaceae bacterium]
MKKGIFFSGLVLFILLFSCTGRGSDLKDGYYSAIAKDWDTYGWKEFITICVNNGVITTVEYNAVNQAGFVKSWDTDYMSLMKSVVGTYPLEYTRVYAGELLRTQGGEEIDAMTGATTSWHTFRQLSAAVLANAGAGGASMAEVPIIPADGEHVRE